MALRQTVRAKNERIKEVCTIQSLSKGPRSCCREALSAKARSRHPRSVNRTAWARAQCSRRNPRLANLYGFRGGRPERAAVHTCHFKYKKISVTRFPGPAAVSKRRGRRRSVSQGQKGSRREHGFAFLATYVFFFFFRERDFSPRSYE